MARALALALGLALVAAPGAGAATPLHGTFTGTTAVGEPITFAVGGKTTRSEKRPRPRRLTWVKFLSGSVPVACSIAEDHGQELGLPGPLGVGRKGRFARTGVSDAGVNGRAVTWVAGQFTSKRRASGTLTLRGGFFGDHCEGATTWSATLDPSAPRPTRISLQRRH